MNNERINATIDAQEFVKKASEKGMAEIDAANTAMDKAEQEQVKKFAERMIQDHQDANQKLKLVAKQQGLEIEEDASLMDKVKKAALKVRLGDSFDHAYIDNQISEHKKAIELFEQGTHSNNVIVSDFARETLPKLREHLNHAEQIHAALA